MYSVNDTIFKWHHFLNISIASGCLMLDVGLLSRQSARLPRGTQTREIVKDTSPLYTSMGWNFLWGDFFFAILSL